MASSILSFGFALIAVFLSMSRTEAKSLPGAGLLDEMPKNCSGFDFCLEKHTDYPQEKINALLTKKYNLVVESEHEARGIRNGIAEDESDCEKSRTFGEIFEIVDEFDRVRVVVQSPNIFKQQIWIEQCVNPGRLQHEDGTLHFSSEELKINNISCVEKKLDYSFLVLTQDGHGLESVKSKNGIPVCCSCRFIESS